MPGEAALVLFFAGGLRSRGGCVTGGPEGATCGLAVREGSWSANLSLPEDEFAVAMYLCHQIMEGVVLPDAIDPNLIPPSKRTIGRP